ncbi:phosphopantothenoylcysteine decarboxylase subunit VHS3 [Lucilia cuprina]|uniref:phosphopantothenoylcysteine decarboxylase subunit VHS3 n=1 Tax=Lucilia cuprina TaxID=7375 RepID=UPI001F0635D5|nr:phosphopantothenoylcysteine decarboxylase subunit VHS3 [Lucilia cuprina]
MRLHLIFVFALFLAVVHAQAVPSADVNNEVQPLVVSVFKGIKSESVKEAEEEGDDDDQDVVVQDADDEDDNNEDVEEEESSGDDDNEEDNDVNSDDDQNLDNDEDDAVEDDEEDDDDNQSVEENSVSESENVPKPRPLPPHQRHNFLHKRFQRKKQEKGDPY